MKGDTRIMAVSPREMAEGPRRRLERVDPDLGAQSLADQGRVFALVGADVEDHGVASSVGPQSTIEEVQDERLSAGLDVVASAVVHAHEAEPVERVPRPL